VADLSVVVARTNLFWGVSVVPLFAFVAWLDRLLFCRFSNIDASRCSLCFLCVLAPFR
jgi:hypothetical protein